MSPDNAAPGGKDEIADEWAAALAEAKPETASRLKQRIVKHGGCDIATIIGAATLGIRSHKDIEALSRMHDLASLFDKVRLAFKNTLQAHDLGRVSTVSLVKEHDCTELHGAKHRALEELGLTVDQTEATDQVVLVSLA